MLNHILKRGVEHLQTASPEHIAQLRADAELHQKMRPVSLVDAFPVFVTGVVFFIILGLMRYTLNDVVTSLAMVESSCPPIALVDRGQREKLPAYTDEEELLVPISDADREISIPTTHERMTHSLCMTLRHLRRVGGAFAYWRGAHIRIFYSLAYAFISNLLSNILFGRGPVGGTFASMLTILLLVPLHTLWTHSMIAYPSKKSLLQRLVPRAQCKPLILPTLIYTAAEKATFLIPLGLAHILHLSDQDSPDNFLISIQTKNIAQLASFALRMLVVLLASAILAFFVLIPASATLRRVEALLLPADVQPIVDFDRAALLGSIDLTAPGSSRALFAAAWRSSTTPTLRLRMIKLYAKTLSLQTAVGVFGTMVMATEVYLIGGERLGVLLTSVRAHLELKALGAL